MTTRDPELWKVEPLDDGFIVKRGEDRVLGLETYGWDGENEAGGFTLAEANIIARDFGSMARLNPHYDGPTDGVKR